MNSKKRSIIIAAAVIVVLAVACAVFSPFIKSGIQRFTANKYTSYDLKNVDNIVLLADCCTVDGKTNSVAGVKEAVRLGADAVLVDLCFRADGTPVITDNYEENETAQTVEELFATLNEDKYKDIKIYLNIVQLSGFTELNRLAVSYNMVGRATLCGIDEAHYGLVTSDDTILPFLLEYEFTSEEKKSIENGEFSAPECLARYGADGIEIDASDVTSEIITNLNDFGIPFIVTGVDNVNTFCQVLVNSASTVLVNDISLCSDILDSWTLAMQERHSSSVEQSLEDIMNK